MLEQRPSAVVTGAAGGLGRSFAKRLAERGGRLFLSDVDEAGLEETRSIVAGMGAEVHVARCDVANPSDVEALRDKALAALREVDLVVNNAGVAVGGKVGDIPIADWNWIVGINLMGVVHGCHFFVPHLKQRGRGHVLNVASIAGFVYSPEMAPYTATKAAVVALTESLVLELRPHGVGATVLCPYFFRTNIARASRSSSQTTETSQIERLMEKTKVQSDDVAELALKAAEKDRFYCFPHVEAKVMQAVRRAAPNFLRDVVIPKVVARQSRSS